MSNPFCQRTWSDAGT